MEIHIDGIDHTIAEIEIALRYAASDAVDADVRAALLVAATALQGVKEAEGA